MKKENRPDYKIEIKIKDKKVIDIMFGNYKKYETFKNWEDVDKIMIRNLKNAINMIKGKVE